jgi:hypothetical protein
MVLYDIEREDKFIFKNSEDKQGTSYLSKYLSYVKMAHLLASPAKLIFFGLYPFYKIGAKLIL